MLLRIVCVYVNFYAIFLAHTHATHPHHSQDSPSTPSQESHPVQDDTDYSALDHASHDELVGAVKKQRQTALRYKGRFTEVSVCVRERERAFIHRVLSSYLSPQGMENWTLFC